MENKTIIGILAIIFGLLIMIFPFAGQIALSVIVGIGILILSIYLFILGVESWSSSKTASIAYIILGILLLLFGILMLGNVFIFDYTVIIYLK